MMVAIIVARRTITRNSKKSQHSQSSANLAAMVVATILARIVDKIVQMQYPWQLSQQLPSQKRQEKSQDSNQDGVNLVAMDVVPTEIKIVIITVVKLGKISKNSSQDSASLVAIKLPQQQPRKEMSQQYFVHLFHVVEVNLLNIVIYNLLKFIEI